MRCGLGVTLWARGAAVWVGEGLEVPWGHGAMGPEPGNGMFLCGLGWMPLWVEGASVG